MLVLAKAPVQGRVKTRLCPPCSLQDAARLAEAALRDTLAAVAGTSCARRVLALDGPIGPWLPAGFEVVPQCTGGLGERLAGALAIARGPAVVVGMDTPQVTESDLDGALARLTAPGCDAVLGPALDGGYWAVGLRRTDPRVFRGVPMSSERTYAAQLERLVDLGYRTTVLPPMRDADRFDDAIAVAAAAPATRFASAVNQLATAVAP